MFFQRKNSKKVKDSEGSQKKGSRGKNDLFDRAKGGLDALAGSLQSAKNDAETATEKLQEDVKSGIETILHKGSGLIEKAKEELGGHSEASRSKELGSKDKEPVAEEKPEEGEAAQNVDNGASADKTEESNVVEQAVEEIQAVVAAVQQEQTAPTTETPTPTENAATAETSAEGEKPEETNREVEKDDPKKRLDFLGFFAMLFERFCSPGNKKKD
ncbi:unnamed protein product [Urochloa decumbens]|uniref:Uncharacterized protein n=1 Tax=Urochloa decumbens TaxID=240449 RepID=A0ABC8YTA3_9POAL